MKKTNFKFFYVLFCTLFSASLVAQTEFITTWKTDNDGTSGTTEITIPTNGSGYNYDVDWNNDGTFDEFGLTGNVTHDFVTAGTYTIRIQGDFPSIRFNAGGDKAKILSVDQWGTIAWSSFQYAFRGCSNLDVVATDAPDLSAVSNLNYAFDGCDTLSGNLSSWDVSGITSMFRALVGCYISADISGWNVSNVSQFERMFGNATILSDITGWTITSAQDLSYMFSGSESFNQDISSWDLNGVTNIAYMFNSTTSFDKDLGDWDMSTVTNLDFLFNDSKLSLINYDSTLIKWSAQSVNSGLTANFGESRYCAGESSKSILENTYGWTISDGGLHCPTIPLILTVKTDNSGVSSSTSFELPVFGTDNDYSVDWNNDGTYDETGLTGTVTHDFTTAGTYTIRIFDESFNGLYFNNSGDKDKLLSIDQWGDLDWQNAENAFYGCSNLTITATDTIDTYWLNSVSGMFRNCSSLNDDISWWNVEAISDFSYFLSGATSFNQDLSTWDVGAGTDFSFFFENASSFDQDLSDWNMDNAVTLESMFQNCTSFNQELYWSATNDLEILTNTFNGATIFNQRIRSWEVEKLTDATGFLVGTSFSPSYYDLLLNSWGDQGAQNVTLDVDTTYCHGSRWRDTLTMNYNWTINDSGESCVDHEFITTWRTDSTGTSNNTSITIPNLYSSHNYDVDWNNDGVYDEFSISSNVTHDFGTAGTYTIRIRGDLSNIAFANAGDRRKLMSIDQWGTIPWTTWWSSFYGCENLTVNATDAPNFSAISNMFQSFRGCSNLSGNFNHWDVSPHSSFTRVFMDATNFNSDISNWDVSNGSNFSYMLLGTENFNQDISGWDVSSATNMESMFQEATSFNQDISGWDMSSVTSIEGMFYDADAFDQNLGSWNVENVTNAETFLSLKELSKSNYDSLLIGWSQQNLQQGVILHAGDSKYCLGESARESMITDFGWTITDDGLDCAGSELVTVWTTDNPGASGTTEITIPTNSGTYTYAYDVDWDDDGVYDTLGVTGDITHDYGVAGTNTVRIKGTFPQFYFNNGGDYAKITDVQSWGDIQWLSGTNAFRGCDSLNVSATDTIDLSNATAINRMFSGTEVFNGNISHWDVSTITNFSQLFGGASVFNQPLNDWDMSAATNLNSMFAGAHNFNQDLDNWDVSLVQNMATMFHQATDFDKPLGNWDVSSVSNFYSTFREAPSFNQNLNSWDVTSVTNMGSMFRGANSFNDSIQNWDVSGVFNMESMFYGASVFNQNISGWDVGSVVDMSSMFRLTPVFDQAIGVWDVSNVTNMESCFRNTDVFNQDLSSWDVGSVTNMQNMFNGTVAFDQDIGMWDVDSVTNMSGMFNTSGLSTANYDNLLIGWNAQNLQSGISFDGGNSMYCAGEAARANMIANDLWTISDNGPDDITAPVPDVATLSDVVEECEITSLTAPTATDGCASVVTVTNDATLPISTQGSTTLVTWTYDDGHGNTSTQTQNLIIADITAPVADAATLSDVTAECEVTSLTAPTATDNCSSNVTVTHDATLPITVQGTTIVTWTYDDGHGNTSTQTQNVVIQDVTPPTASNPTAISVECAGDVPVASITDVTDEADNCSGALTVTFESDVSDGLSCPETITRTYRVTDAAGLFIDVVQTITVQDLTAPVLDSVSLSAETGYCDITPLTPTATDNCTGSVDGVADVTFPINTIGTTTITWTFTDDCGNTTSQTQDVTIEEIEIGTSIANDNITMTANNVDAGVSYQWIDCSSNNLPVPGATGPTFTPVVGGDYAVIITQGGCSETSACVNSTVGIEELTVEDVVLYPNPSIDGIIYIKTESNIEEIRVFDMMGRLIQVPTDLELYRINASDLTRGKYLISIKTDQSSIVKEIVIGH